jgi:membrane associated rhomboid family serine protease
MWFLWIFGNNVEDSMGSLRFLIFYLLCGLFAHGGQFLYIRLTAGPPPSIPLPPSLLLELGSPSVQWFIPMVGASGAISGVMAAYGRLFPHARVHTILPVLFYITVVSVPAGLMIGYWFLLQVLQGVLAPPVGGGIAFFAHIGGFVAGWFLYYPFLRPQIRERIAFQKRWRKYLQENLF